MKRTSTYLLRQRRNASLGQVAGFAIIAPSEVSARAIAADNAEGEGSETWQDRQWSTCTRVGTASPALPAQVLIRDYNAS